MIPQLTHDEEVELQLIHEAHRTARQMSTDRYNLDLYKIEEDHVRARHDLERSIQRKLAGIEQEFTRLIEEAGGKNIARRHWNAVYVVLTLAGEAISSPQS